MAITVQQRLNEVAAVGQEIAETGVAYLDGKFTPLADAKVSIATHALQYGTGVFEGIRAYWNPAQEQLYVFRLREHFERMARSVRIVRITLPADAEALSAIALELLRKNSFKSDVYVRPLAFKAARSVKVALQGLRDGFGMYAFPLGAYLPTGGLVARTASWRRTSDDAIPARASSPAPTSTPRSPWTRRTTSKRTRRSSSRLTGTFRRVAARTFSWSVVARSSRHP